MKKILYLTLVSVLITSVLTFFLLPLILLCAPFPAFLAVLMYEYVNRKFFPHNKLYGALTSLLLLLFTYHLILIVVIGFIEPWSNIVHTLSEEYFDEFAIPNIPAIALAFSIPLADVLIEKVKRDMAEEKEKDKLRQGQS